MLNNLINRLTILPRWVIIILDLLVLVFSTVLAYTLRFNFNWADISQFNLTSGVFLITGCGLLAITLTKSYAGIVRYTGVEDGVRILYATLLSMGIAALFNILYFYNSGKNLVPYSVLLITFFVAFLILFNYRLLVKIIFSHYKGEVLRKVHVAIFGAGSLGMITRNVIETDKGNSNKLIAFLEDDYNKAGKVINGIPIYHTSELEQLIERYNIKELIIAVKDISAERKAQIVETCINQKIKVRMVPPVEKWVKGEFRAGQIKSVNIEDLLGRDTIILAEDKLYSELGHKRICITGAAGSIGSELARQVINYHPSCLILIDQAETPLYEIEKELRNSGIDTRIIVFVADVTNEKRMRHIMHDLQPQIVLHAAAYKHVPMMESNPSEAVINNIIGTKLMSDLAVEFEVERFVMVSTDKAVNPSSVMGCSKRIAEIYVQSLNNNLSKSDQVHTNFITTRFGNVLGSNGSVIPIFRQQIESGGPITVTHPEITRYFMTIPEACSLVLEAGVMGSGGEIFIFDMGKPIRIYDLARKMIKLSGLEPDKDIDIVFTGLREGEKLYEELLNTKENTIPTHHSKILKARVAEYDYTYINSMISLFQDLIHDKNELKMVALMKEIVPEFKSTYSRYEILDRD
ncbi:MAG TPA: nucleoside-diphosphate sugar epimerase/dehydratase [Cyclobacteriaceae bacterium]|nr:nucleoside-diphosphate sugar epimerase/dehydratase [Cyclobacteriaceae bacterium]